MRTILIILFLFFFNLGFSQQINLSDKEDLVKFLNNKEFNVGNYGKIIFDFDKYEKNFNMVNFKVTYEIQGNKKPKKIKLYAKVYLSDDSFNSFGYVRDIKLTKEESVFFDEPYPFPTIFLLFENGELYYRDKNSMTMNQYIDVIKKGGDWKFNIPKYYLCN